MAFTFGTDIVPDSNGSRSLGSSSAKWSDIQTNSINGTTASNYLTTAGSVITITAASGSWSSATPPTQTISATGVTASNNIIVTLASNATSAQYDVYVAAKIMCTAQAANSVTLTAYGTKPTINIPFSVLILN